MWWAVIFMFNTIIGDNVTTTRGDFGDDLAYCQAIVAYAAMQAYVFKVETNCPVPRHQLNVRLLQTPGATWCRLEEALAPEARERGCVVQGPQ